MVYKIPQSSQQHSPFIFYSSLSSNTIKLHTPRMSFNRDFNMNNMNNIDNVFGFHDRDFEFPNLQTQPRQARSVNPRLPSSPVPMLSPTLYGRPNSVFPSNNTTVLPYSENPATNNHWGDYEHFTPQHYAFPESGFGGHFTTPVSPRTMPGTMNYQPIPLRNDQELGRQGLIEGYSEPREYVCRWEGCPNKTGFRKVTCLRRHVETLHVAPGSFICSYHHCAKSFNRQEHLRNHERTMHVEREDINDESSCCTHP